MLTFLSQREARGYPVQCLKFTYAEAKTQGSSMICLSFNTQVVVEEADERCF